MRDLQLIKDYRDNERARTSFFKLAAQMFGLRFEDWYRGGFWNESYIPFSYMDNGNVIANVSINTLDLIIGGKKKKAIQIGTVMTHPDYRKRGLSAELMNKVLEEYENKVELMYLFANREVLHFYPKFGFKAVNEVQFSMSWSSSPAPSEGIRQLDGKNKDDLHFIQKFASARKPVSRIFGTEHAESILMYYCMNVFQSDIYYLEQEDVIAIYKQKNSRLDIFEIISKTETIDIEEILRKISGADTNNIVFHYTPDYIGMPIEWKLFNGDEILFVRTNSNLQLPDYMKHPITSQA